MDKYKWENNPDYDERGNPLQPRLERHCLFPVVEGANGNMCRACVVQTGENRWCVHDNNVNMKVQPSAFHSGFTSLDSAKAFVERMVSQHG